MRWAILGQVALRWMHDLPKEKAALEAIGTYQTVVKGPLASDL